MTDCRLILDPPAAGAWNMAVDEVLWDWSGRTGCWCLRMYRWAEPTLSLGYFQTYDERWGHEASRSCSVVRRISGGGAILHDAEWTYSVAVPLGHLGGVGSQTGLDVESVSNIAATHGGCGTVSHAWLYEAVHGAIVELLAGFGVEASIQAADHSSGPQPSPFLCFQRRSPGDVLVGAVKVAGSAQRRSHSAVLQHGSLLLAQSPAAPELPVLKEITGQDFAVESVLEGLLGRLSKRLKLNWIVGPLSQDERYGTAQLVADKHGAEAWVTQRGRTGQNPLDTRPRPR